MDATKKFCVLIMRPAGDGVSPGDQTLAARLSADSDVAVEEQYFRPDQPGDLETKLAPWQGKIAGVVGATQVSDSEKLGLLAERMDVLCFVANNNTVVWQKRRNIFHIGFPTSQTTGAVAAELVRKTSLRRYLLLHDITEFQGRVASTMEKILLGYGMEVKSLVYTPGDPLELGSWQPELVYVVFSSERKALQVVQALASRVPEVPLLLGRSLLRESFLRMLRGCAGEFWFVDSDFRRSRLHTEAQQRFIQVMEENGIKVPTTNHAFGWDCMRFCILALRASGGDPRRAIDYLESGVTLEGASGTCSFSPDNHNGRRGHGPTLVSRWKNGGFEDMEGIACAQRPQIICT
jgi:ABC-type branched-subunit amino acid transport system substrate-binding protein